MYLRRVCLAITLLSLASCNTISRQNSEDEDSVEALAQQSQHSKYKHSLHKVRSSLPKLSSAQQEEYVQRVGQRVVIVSDAPETQIDIKVSSDNNVILSISGNNTITVSKGYLENLKSEAQLAAALGQAIAKIQHKHSVDKTSMEYIARAGYDPKALPEIQEHALSSGNTNLQGPFHHAIDRATIESNKNYAKKFPQGLKTNEFDYQRNFMN